MRKITVNDILESKVAELQSRLLVSLNHPVSQGNHCESSWIDFLSSFLPKRYGVAKGFVFDSNEKISEQIDVIIYDALYSPLIYETKANEKYVTSESVYAVFECKPKISKSNIEYANNKINSVRSLHRTTRPVYVAGKPTPSRESARIIGGLLATDHTNTITASNHLKDNPEVDICLAAKGLMLFRKTNEVQSIEGEKAMAAFYYKILDLLYESGTVAAGDIRKYARRVNKLGDDLFGDVHG